MTKPLTVGCVSHWHAERWALPGFIESAKAMFDEVVLVSSPMDGTPHCEESLAIARASGCKVILDTLSQGFGALRTRCISYSSCDWVFVLDADERIKTITPEMTCHGGEKFPEAAVPSLEVEWSDNDVDQHKALREVVAQAEAEGSLAVCLSRRHWLSNPNICAPAQNWHQHPDPQLRLVKNTPWLCYDPTVKMHERLLDTRTWDEPKFLRTNKVFIDHYSIYYKSLEPEQNAEDARTYEQLVPGCAQDMWLNHFPKS